MTAAEIRAMLNAARIKAAAYFKTGDEALVTDIRAMVETLKTETAPFDPFQEVMDFSDIFEMSLASGNFAAIREAARLVLQSGPTLVLARKILKDGKDGIDFAGMAESVDSIRKAIQSLKAAIEEYSGTGGDAEADKAAKDLADATAALDS